MTEQIRYWACTADNEVLEVPASEDLPNTFETVQEAEYFLIDYQIMTLENLLETN